MANPSDTHLSKCIACKEPIDASARLCSKCKSYQKPWKNVIQYIAGIVGILALSGIFFVFIVSKIPEVRKVLFWQVNVKVISFESHGAISVANSGDGKVFLTHVSIRTEHGATHTYVINQSLDPGAIITYEADAETTKRLSSYDVISKVTMDAWKKAVSTYGMTTDLNTCVPFAVLYERTPKYLMYKDYFKEGFMTIKATASLHFLSIPEQQTKEQPFPVRGILLQNPDKQCKPHYRP